MFKPGIIYPQDHIGRYIDLEGPIVEARIILSDTIAVSIQIDEGIFTAYARWSGDYLPQIGWHATIRHYDWGGGFYPDDRLIGWSNYNYVPAKADPINKSEPLPLPE